MKNVLKWGCLTLLILTILGGIGLFLLGKTLWGAADKMVQDPPKEELVIVDTQQYSNDYVQDPTGRKYAGKIVEIAGVVKQVNKDNIELEGEKNISIDFQKNVKITDLTVGDTVTIRGFDAGYDKDKDEFSIVKSIVIK
ncbi:hypothetical protein FT637_14710 [Bacillus cereus]|uniref:OB-fold protein n=1 Tax=Bacillus cereus TaxID=1396 RepID=UPI001879EAE5|nr:hypothetical protein [Bacillus cereus]MBE7104254.1 hypothetical protein [Bacillus cereus]